MSARSRGKGLVPCTDDLWERERGRKGGRDRVTYRAMLMRKAVGGNTRTFIFDIPIRIDPGGAHEQIYPFGGVAFLRVAQCNFRNQIQQRHECSHIFMFHPDGQICGQRSNLRQMVKPECGCVWAGRNPIGSSFQPPTGWDGANTYPPSTTLLRRFEICSGGFWFGRRASRSSSTLQGCLNH